VNDSSANGQGQAGVGHAASAQHQIGATGLLAAAQSVLHGPDFTIGDDANLRANGCADQRDLLPVGGRAVAIGLGAGVNDQLTRAVFYHGLGAFAHQAPVVKTQAHFGRYRQMRWHGTAHSSHQAGDVFRVLQHGGTATVAVHGAGRAAKIQVNPLRPQGGEEGSVLGHADGVRAQQLRPHWHARQGAAAIGQLGHITQKNTLRQERATDADKFRNAAIGPANAGEDIAQHKVEQPLHRGKKQLHGRWVVNLFNAQQKEASRDCHKRGVQ